MAGVTIAAGVGTIASASASTTPLTIETSMYPCTSGACSMGVGNVGMTYESDPIATGGPEYSGPESSPYVWTVVSGSLPAGLSLDGGILSGTPAKAGTSSFTLHASDLAGGPAVSQAFSITIGTGSSDRVVVTAADYTVEGEKLVVDAVDANTAVTLTVSLTSTGAKIGTLSTFGTGMFNGTFFGPDGTMTPQDITVTSSLGGSATSAVTLVAKPH
jgi:large repetitive protein